MSREDEMIYNLKKFYTSKKISILNTLQILSNECYDIEDRNIRYKVEQNIKELLDIINDRYTFPILYYDELTDNEKNNLDIYSNIV